MEDELVKLLVEISLKVDWGSTIVEIWEAMEPLLEVREKLRQVQKELHKDRAFCFPPKHVSSLEHAESAAN